MILMRYFHEAKEIFLQFIHQKNFWKKFLFVYMVYLFSFSSILLANYLYGTDWSRASGLERPEFVNWQLSARFLNTVLSYIINLSDYPQDISPALQLVSIFILSFTSLLMVFMLTKKLTYTNILLSVIIGISPYFLQNFSYSFDCIYFSLSVFLAVFPFLFYDKNKLFYILSGLCLAGCYLSYQSAISVYMMLVLVYTYTDYLGGILAFKQIFIKFLATVGVFLSVFMGYFLLTHFVVFTPFIEEHSTFCSLPTCHVTALDNLKKLIAYFYFHWKKTPIGWIFLINILCFFVFQMKQAVYSKGHGPVILRIIFSLFFSALLLLLVVLWYVFFAQIAEWSPRVFIGTGVAFCIMLLSMRAETSAFLRKIFLFFSILCIYACVIFSLRVGNLLELERRYEDFKIFTLSQDLASLSHKEILFKNTPSIYSPVVIRKSRQYPILRHLVSPIKASFPRFYHYFLGFYRRDLKKCSNQNYLYKRVLINNPHHRITQINNSCVLIELKN